MAETIVNLVLGKLSEAVVQEALFLSGVRDKVERVQRDLKWIQSFLKDADTKRHKDERVKQWVNEVQEVGYMIEDVLEKFLAEFGGGRSEDLPNILKKIGKMPKKLIAKHKVGNEIDKIHERLREIKENTTLYGIDGLKESSSGASVKLPIRPFLNPDIDDMEVVGFKVDKKIIVDQLIHTNITRRSVISIVGAGGSGKTTLAKDVYKSAEVKRHFGISMWLTISQEYNLKDILIKMLEEIQKVDKEEWEKGEEYFIAELNEQMKKKKYLVVLDDVWSSDVWTQLELTVPNARNGSRVLITTRFIEIPEMADKKSKPHEIQPLNEEQSKQLLLGKIFPNQFANECPSEVLPLATQFTKICGGWPLPLVVLGGILSRKNPNYHTWDEVMRKKNWQNMVSDVVSTSYEDLPTSLKPCFMYFGVFPEDYQIKATTLIQLWIAEGFIRQDDTEVLEDIAETYLEELVQRCMVQVSSRSCIGKIKYCHLHDLLRDLAIQKAKEDNFLTICKNETELSHSTCARRVALHGYDNNMIEHTCQKTYRSLLNFVDVPNLNWFGTLRVLHMNFTSANFVERGQYLTNSLKGLNTLTALKYFRIGGDINCNFTKVTYSERHPLNNMKNLQTVFTWFCKKEGNIPPSFWGNKQLRHINFHCCWACKEFPEGPPSATATHLQSLLILKGVRARQDWVPELPNFPNIRKLRIVIPEDVAGEPLINSLSNLNHLGSLHLTSSIYKRMNILDGISAFKNHNRLHSFKLLNGIWRRKETGDCTLFPPHLVKLTLENSIFEGDPMPQLEKSNLRVLKLFGWFNEAADGKQMICSRGGFGSLQKLVLWVYDLEEWKIEEGAMPMLNQLNLCSNRLKLVPDFQCLVNLNKFNILRLSEVVKSRLQGEEQWKIKHIPSVIWKMVMIPVH